MVEMDKTNWHGCRDYTEWVKSNLSCFWNIWCYIRVSPDLNDTNLYSDQTDKVIYCQYVKPWISVFCRIDGPKDLLQMLPNKGNLHSNGEHFLTLCLLFEFKWLYFIQDRVMNPSDSTCTMILVQIILHETS